MEPTPLAIIPLTSPYLAPHLMKAMVEGIAKGFLQIHPEVELLS
jgi:hypothetical protein